METEFITLIDAIILIIKNNVSDIIHIKMYFSVLIFTFISIKTVDYFNGKQTVAALMKRIITLIVSLIFGFFYYLNEVKDISILLNAAALAIISYDWAVKSILEKHHIGYRKDNV